MKPGAQYALSTLGKTIPFAAADAFSLYFYTDVAGIAPGLAGTIVLALLSWSALCDPLAGRLYQTGMMRRHGDRMYFAAWTIVATVFFILSFAPLPALGLAMAGMAFRLAYAMIDVPHNALLSGLQRSGQSGARLGGLRLGATIGGTLLTIGAARFALAGHSASTHFLLFAIATGLAGGVLFLSCFPFAILGAGSVTATRPVGLLQRASGKVWVAAAALFLAAVAATVINGIFSKDIVYIAKYVFDDPAWTVTGMTLFTIGKVAGMPCWIWLSERQGEVRTMQGSFLLVAATGLGVAIAPPHFSYLGTGLFFFGAGLAGTNIAGWALMPTCAALFRPGREPMIFGAFTAVNKIASGLSGAIIGATLTLLGIGSNPTSMERQARSLYWLVYLYPVIAAAIGIVSIAVFAALSQGECAVTKGKHKS